MRHNNTFYLAGLFALAIGSSLFGQEAENEWDYDGNLTFPATEAEQAELHDAETKNLYEIRELNSKLRDIAEQIYALGLEKDALVKKLLKPEQIRAINKQRLERTREDVAEDLPFLAEFATFAKEFAAVDKMQILQGLSRATPEKISKIKTDTKTIKIDGFDFYATPLGGKPMTVEQLREILTDYRTFSPTGNGGKFCGGFHPDLCLKYSVGGVEHRVLICLGCEEMRVIGPDTLYKFDYDLPTQRKLIEIAKSIFTHESTFLQSTR